MPYRFGLMIPLHEEYQYLTELGKPLRSIEIDGEFYIEFLPNGWERPLILQVLEDMGPMRTALASERMVARFSVEHLCLIGLAGALDKDLLIGDVVVASEVDYYQYAAKATQGNSSGQQSPQLELAGTHWRGSHSLLERIRIFDIAPENTSQISAWRASLASRMKDLNLSKEQSVFVRAAPISAVGPMASGDNVAAATWFRALLLARNRKFLAVEMEAAGAAYAAWARSTPLNFTVVRGISDFANAQKSSFDEASGASGLAKGAFRKYAMHSAAAFAFALIPWLDGLHSPLASEAPPRDRNRSAARTERKPGKALPIDWGLEDALAQRYHEVPSIRRIMHHAGLSMEAIGIGGSIRDIWFSCLMEARSLGRIGDLAHAAARDYPNVEAFVRAATEEPADAAQEPED